MNTSIRDRNDLIYEAYMAGEACHLIGKRFGLTKQRVIQIARSKGALPRIYEPAGAEQGWQICKVDDCGQTVRSKWGTLCNTHYFRGRRTGSTDSPVRKPPQLTNHGYLAQYWKAHPASSKNGMLYEHRKVFFEKYGADGHSCFWCKESLAWGGVGRGKVHIDHLNGQKCDNRIENLVAACHRCNVNRGLFMSWLAQHKDDPIITALFEQGTKRRL